MHPLLKVANAQAIDTRLRIKIKMAGHARHVTRVRPVDRVQHEHRVLYPARHRTQLVERPGQRHRPGARHAPVCRTQSGNAAPHRRTDNAAAGLAPDREPDQSRRSGRTRTRARSRRRLFQQPRIHRLSTKPNIVQR